MRPEIVHLLHSVAAASNEASTPEEAISRCVDQICQHSGWQVGQAYLACESFPTQITLIRRWFSRDHARFQSFREASEKMGISWGVDIPGRVIATGRPQWEVSVSALDNVVRIAEAEKLGLKQGFGFPVVVGRDVAAVLEFFSNREQLLKDSELFDVIELIATQLARVIERRQAEQNLIRAREAAVEASSAKSDFLAQMSHEIRTPINAVMGMSQLLLSTSLNLEQREYAEAIRKSTQSLLSIVNDVLDFSKIEAGKLDIQNQDFQLDALFKDLFSMFNYSAKAKNLILLLDLDPAIAPVLRGDVGRLKQILVNLIGNAIKFTDAGKINVIASQQREIENISTLRFEVKDTGIGIAKRLHPKIFEMFTQADGSSGRKHGGTGLGLSISKRLVELMGGEIGFQSSEGTGSVFWFTVQLQKPLIAVKPATVEDPASFPESPIDRSSISVLVVEDNPINQTVMLRTLEAKGFFAEALSSGEEALASLELDSHNIVLMDCQMPDMDGYETTRRIREWERTSRTSALPIIAVTANALKEDRERCFSVGMDDYLTKPVDADVLVSRIEYWVKQRPRESGLKRSRIGKLKQIGERGGSLLKELFDIFESHTPERLKVIERAISNHDEVLVAREAHSLKSSSANLGATQMSDTCRKVEVLAEQKNFDLLQGEYVNLVAAYKDVCELLRQETKR